MAGRKKSSWLSFFKRAQDQEISPNLLKNGGTLLQKLVAIFGSRYRNPIHHFAAEQLIMATNNFAEYERHDGFVSTFTGSLDGRLILVSGSFGLFSSDRKIDVLLTDLVVSSQLSHLKNVLNFIGCCLEFDYPVLVYEAAGSESQLLSDFFSSSNNDEFLSWKSRVRIAKDTATTLTYLHTAFSTPIIHRDVKLGNVIIDQNGHSKLFNFGISISLPPGRKHVEDQVAGTIWYVDPEHVSSGRVTPKVDVYSFGIVLLELLTGRLAQDEDIRQIVDHNALHQIADHRIWETKQEARFRAFLDLALRCTQEKGEDRPDMIDVAEQLCRIEKNELISGSSKF